MYGALDMTRSLSVFVVVWLIGRAVPADCGHMYMDWQRGPLLADYSQWWLSKRKTEHVS